MMSRIVTRFYFGVAVILLIAAWTGTASAASCTTVSNTVACTGGTGAIVTAPQHFGTGTGAVSKANNYPTTINVTGGAGSVQSLTVTFHTYMSDGNTNAGSTGVGVLLVSPNGRDMQILRCLGNGSDSQNFNFTLQDGQTQIPSSSGDWVSGGTYKPTAYGPGDCATSNFVPDYSPGPAVAHNATPQGTGTFSNVFTGETTNGNWNLYLIDDDDDNGANVSFASWDIAITFSNATSPTTTTLTPSPTTALTGASVVLTAQVTAGATGTVTFKDGGSNVTCSQGSQPRPLSGSTATCTTTFSTEGLHTLTADYSGDTTFVASTGTANVFAEKATTVTGNVYCNTGAITANGQSENTSSSTTPYPSVITVPDSIAVDTLTFTAKNFSSSNPGSTHMLLVAPDGTHALDFWSNAGAGSAAGAGDYIISDSGSSHLPASGALSPGTYSPSDYGFQISSNFDTFLPGGPAPSPQPPGTSCNAPSPSTPCFNDASPKPNAQTFTSTFSGVAANGAWSLFVYDSGGPTGGSTLSGGWCLSIDPATGHPTTIAPLTATPATPLSPVGQALLGSNVTFSATVNSSPAVNNTGTVAFSENGAVLGTRNLSNNVATFTTNTLTEGDHFILAHYHDSTNTFNDSTATVAIRVDAATPTPTLNTVTNTWTYCNVAGITIPAQSNPPFDAGPAAPNPSNVFVSNLPGTINAVSVTLNSLKLTLGPHDYEMLLVGPNGASAPSTAQTLDFFSLTGDTSAYGPTNTTFADGNPTVACSSGVPSAVNAPSSCPGTLAYTASPFFTLPGTLQRATTAGTSTFANVYGNKLPNGTWSLYIDQTSHDATGSGIAQYCLNFIENPVIVAATKAHIGYNPTGANHFIQGEMGAQFTIDIMNNGPGSTGDPDGGHPLVVTDTLVADLTPGTLPTGSPWNCTAVAQVVTCKSDLAIASATSYPQLVIPVNVSATAGASASNTATISGAGVTSTSAMDTVVIDQVADLTILKAHNGTFKQGDTADTYTITVSNLPSKGSTVGTVTVTDTVPIGLTLVSATGTNWTCSVTAPSLSCNRSDVLASGASYEPITVTVSVATNAPTSLINTATVAGGGEANTANDSSTDTAPITQLADLTLSKTHSGNFFQGQTGATYTLTAHNAAGAGPTSGTVTLTENLPAGLTATGFSGGGWTCSSVSGGVAGPATLTCTRSDALAGGADYPVVTLTVTVSNSAPTGAAAITNTASIAGGGEIVTNNDSASDPTTINIGPDLTITKTHTDPFKQGDTADTYTVTVQNIGGTATVGTTTVQDNLPAGLTVTAITATGWTCPSVPIAGPTTFSCTLATAIAAPGSSTITLTVSVANNATTPVTNSVTVSGGGDVNGGNNTANDLTNITQVADLTISKVHNGTFQQSDVGDTYNITVSNASGHGPTVGTVTVTDTVPTGLTLTNAAGTAWNCTVTAPSFSCTRSDSLGSGASYAPIVVTVNVAANAPASIMNTATVSGGGELNTSNDSSTDTASITQVADLTLTKSHSGSFFQGQIGATYTLAAHNIGSGSSAGTVTVTENLPTGLTATGLSGTGWTCSSLGGGVAGPATLTCTTTSVVAGGNNFNPITLTVNVANNATTGAAAITNTASISGGGEVVTNNDSASDPTTVNAGPDLTVSKTHTDPFKQGDTGKTYTITVQNLGATASVGTTTVQDSLPAGITVTAITAAGWTCPSVPIAGPTSFSCTNTNPIVNGTPTTIVLTVSVANNAAATVTNSATVSGGGDVNGANNTANDLTHITQVADLTVSKMNSPTTFTVGDTADSFTITVTNSGTGATTGTVTMADTLPAGLTITAISATGWTCPPPPISTSFSCTRADVLAAGNSYPAILLTVAVANSTASPLTNVATVSGGGEVNTANNTANDMFTVVQLVNVTLATSPSGLLISLDGATPIASPHTYQLVPGSMHTIATSSPQTAPGTQYLFQNWSDSGAISHTVTIPAMTTTYTANFKTQYLLTTLVSPSAVFGSIAPVTGYYDAGTVQVMATANPGYIFTKFTGDLTGGTNPQNLTLNAPKTVTANFVQDVSNKVSVTQNGFARNRATGLWVATMTVTNTSGSSIAGPIEVVLSNLTPGVTMANNTGTFNGNPYITITTGSLAPGASAAISVQIQFNNPSNGFINFTPLTYSGPLQ